MNAPSIPAPTEADYKILHAYTDEEKIAHDSYAGTATNFSKLPSTLHYQLLTAAALRYQQVFHSRKDLKDLVDRGQREWSTYYVHEITRAQPDFQLPVTTEYCEYVAARARYQQLFSF